jgi:hypothetical protein
MITRQVREVKNMEEEIRQMKRKLENFDRYASAGSLNTLPPSQGKTPWRHSDLLRHCVISVIYKYATLASFESLASLHQLCYLEVFKLMESSFVVSFRIFLTSKGT